MASWEALWPVGPMTQPPGQAPEPQRKSPEIGPWYDCEPGTGRIWFP
jgi:hypothetical protein